MSVVTVPAWAMAVRRVQRVLDHRTVPLLAIFSAFTFAIMMFNIPVPGGTTAHGVGGTLIAIVLGPWAAVIGVSTALIIQALFFGDGGILAIFPNCFNMGVVLPFVGYATYKLIAGRAPLLSNRRVWAAGIAAYLAITVAGLLVGIELGLQPMLFNENGHPIYSPYDLSAAVPAMLLAHMLGASVVEGLITALGIAYLQKSHPEYLTARSLRAAVTGVDVPEGTATGRPIWQTFAAIIVGGTILLFLAGLVTGGGDPSRLFGADWSGVDWASVATMLLVVAVIAVVLLPLTWLVLPRGLKAVGTWFMGLAVLAPLGLIAPGFAYGEGSAEDVEAAFGYVPQGLQDVSGLFSAPLADYNLPLPFFSEADAPLWHAAIGYELSGIIGFALLGLVVYGLASLLRGRGSPSSASEPSRA
jgi:cobalt/nickel transport system permease protein